MRRASARNDCRKSLLAVLAGAAFVMPMAPAGAATDFQLPPGNTPAPQGPVAPGEAPPRPATPAPSPTPRPTPRPTTTPIVVEPEPAPTVAVPTPARPAAEPVAGASPAVPSATPEDDTPAVSTGAEFDPFAQDRPPPAAPGETTAAPQAEDRGGPALPSWWPWAAGSLALFAVLAGAALFLTRRRKQAPAREIERPRIQRPRVADAAAPAPPAQAPDSDEPERDEDGAHGPLTIAVEARELTISLGAATLAYRITLTNTGKGPLGGVAIAGDMISAHSSFAPEDQLATAESELAPQHEIERIKPGESVQVTGEFRLPLRSIRPIIKGKAAIFVPLARLRVETAQGGNGAVMRTALVGQRAAQPGGALQPFRLDLGPRIYREVTQKIFS